MDTVSDMMRFRSGFWLAAIAAAFAFALGLSGQAFAADLPDDDFGQPDAIEQEFLGLGDDAGTPRDGSQGETASGIAQPAGHEDAIQAEYSDVIENDAAAEATAEAMGPSKTHGTGGASSIASKSGAAAASGFSGLNNVEGTSFAGAPIGEGGAGCEACDQPVFRADASEGAQAESTRDQVAQGEDIQEEVVAGAAFPDSSADAAASGQAIAFESTVASANPNQFTRPDKANNEEEPDSLADAKAASAAKPAAGARRLADARASVDAKPAAHAKPPAGPAHCAKQPAVGCQARVCEYAYEWACEQASAETQAQNEPSEQPVHAAMQKLARRAGSSNPATPAFVEAGTNRANGPSPAPLFALLPDRGAYGPGVGAKAANCLHDHGGSLLYGKARCRSP